MKNKKSDKIFQSLNGMYVFLEDAYKGNWELRWRKTPYMEEAIRSQHTESVLGHMWSMMAMWYFLQRICPALRKAVDSNRVYELILLHDVGESQIGDISMYQKILGFDANKKKEREMVCEMSREFPESSGILTEVVGTFDAFETPTEDTDSLESLIAKFIDGMQGGHFAVVYGNDLAKFSKPIEKILKKHFVPNANRLMALLREKGFQEASDEVALIVREQVKRIQSAGIQTSVQSLGIKLPN